MIKHVVGVNLSYSKEDPQVKEFFDAAKQMLGSISHVASYGHFMQTQTDTPFSYGFILEFENKNALEKYLSHPSHLAFTEKYWDGAVVDFIDLNFIAFE